MIFLPFLGIKGQEPGWWWCLVYDRECAEMWSELRFMEQERYALLKDNNVLANSLEDLNATLVGKQGT